MKRYNIAKDTFIIPFEDYFILYAPLKNKILKINGGVVSMLKNINNAELPDSDNEVFKMLVNNEFIILNTKEKIDGISETPINEDNFRPTSVTLFPTSDCNMACVYCFASAGETSHKLDLSIAKEAINFIAKNAIDKKQDYIRVGFHGGGEPLFNFKFTRDILKYSKEKCQSLNLKLKTSTATNGILNPTQLNWINENIDNVSLSFDGPAHIQDIIRPLKNGKGSTNYVLKSVKFFEENNISYSIRSTITNYSIENLIEIIDFFSQISTNKTFHFEPVIETGRCSSSGTQGLSPKIFLEKLISAKEYAKNKRLNIYYSSGRIGEVMNKFCGAVGQNFFITPLGEITSCIEVSKVSDSKSDIFFYGKYNKETGFKFDFEKLNYLGNRTVNNIPSCQSCFAKYNCAGDCLVKLKKDIYDTSTNDRCELNRGILAYELQEIINNQIF